MIQYVRDFLRQTRGATAIEYAMICAMIFVVIVGAVTALGSGVATTLYSKLAAAM